VGITSPVFVIPGNQVRLEQERGFDLAHQQTHLKALEIKVKSLLEMIPEAKYTWEQLEKHALHDYMALCQERMMNPLVPFHGKPLVKRPSEEGESLKEDSIFDTLSIEEDENGFTTLKTAFSVRHGDGSTFVPASLSIASLPPAHVMYKVTGKNLDGTIFRAAYNVYCHNDSAVSSGRNCSTFSKFSADI
jgi:hypothetical protein